MIQRDADEKVAQIGFRIAVGAHGRGALTGAMHREVAAATAKLK